MSATGSMTGVTGSQSRTLGWAAAIRASRDAIDKGEETVT